MSASCSSSSSSSSSSGSAPDDLSGSALREYSLTSINNRWRSCSFHRRATAASGSPWGRRPYTDPACSEPPRLYPASRRPQRTWVRAPPRWVGLCLPRQTTRCPGGRYRSKPNTVDVSGSSARSCARLWCCRAYRVPLQRSCGGRSTNIRTWRAYLNPQSAASAIWRRCAIFPPRVLAC